MLPPEGVAERTVESPQALEPFFVTQQVYDAGMISSDAGIETRMRRPACTLGRLASRSCRSPASCRGEQHVFECGLAESTGRKPSVLVADYRCLCLREASTGRPRPAARD